MKSIYSRFIIISLLIATHFTIVKAQNKATEIRAVWLTTIWNLDWPSAHLSVADQKKQLQTMLDQLQASNINTVFFQTRLRGDVFYYSKIESLSPFAKKGFDPLAFAIEECHKRGMECHAWFVTFPVGSKKSVAAQKQNTVVKKQPALCKLHNSDWYLDPGNPGTRTYLRSLVREIVENYDIDGIHFDYIRYPENAAKFPDADTYKKYGNGMNLKDWRRNNITTFVTEMYDEVKSLKPWVQVSSSPVGKYKNLSYDRGTWTAYESVYQDAAYWLQIGKHDALYPMMYYKNDHFYPYMLDWQKNSNNRFIVPGLGSYQMMASESNWNLKDVTDQIDFTREHNAQGQAYFRANNLTQNLKGLNTALRGEYYQYPAKQPAMTWLDDVAPNSPTDFEVFVNEKGFLTLRWKPQNNDETLTYNIYCSSDENIDIENPANILATGIRSNQAEFHMTYGGFGLYYTVTASDRFHNESVITFPAFFVHANYEK